MFSGFRELLKHPVLRYAVPCALILVVAMLMYFQLFDTRAYPPGISESAYYTTDDAAAGDAAVKALFVDSISKIPPFDHNGKPAYKAIVYTAGRTKWVNHLVRYDAKAKQALETQVAERIKQGIKTGPDLAAVGDAGMEVKVPGQGSWIKSSDPEFLKVNTIRLPQGVHGADVDIATP